MFLEIEVEVESAIVTFLEEGDLELYAQKTRLVLKMTLQQNALFPLKSAQ